MPGVKGQMHTRSEVPLGECEDCNLINRDEFEPVLNGKRLFLDDETIFIELTSSVLSPLTLYFLVQNNFDLILCPNLYESC